MPALPHLPPERLDRMEDRQRALGDILGALDADAAGVGYGALFDAIDAAGDALWDLHLVIAELRAASDAALEAAGTPREIPAG